MTRRSTTGPPATLASEWDHATLQALVAAAYCDIHTRLQAGA